MMKLKKRLDYQWMAAQGWYLGWPDKPYEHIKWHW